MSFLRIFLNILYEGVKNTLQLFTAWVFNKHLEPFVAKYVEKYIDSKLASGLGFLVTIFALGVALGVAQACLAAVLDWISVSWNTQPEDSGRPLQYSNRGGGQSLPAPVQSAARRRRRFAGPGPSLFQVYKFKRS